MAELYRLDIRKHRNILEKTDIEKAFSEYRIQKIKACKKQEKKEECTLSGLLLDFVLKQHGMTEKEAVFTENADGKRLLETGDINLSHSGNYVVCAYDNAPVGVDIQKIVRDKSGIAKRFFSEEEAKWIQMQEDMALAFTRMWTWKESYAKQKGSGIFKTKSEFYMTPDGEICERNAKNAKEQIYFKEILLDGYCLTICTAKKPYLGEIAEVII